MTFKVNGVTFKSAEVDYNAVCFFEDNGLDFNDVRKKGNSFMRAYFALCAGISVEDAGKLIQEHIINGGDVKPIVDAFAKEIDKSDFFQALVKGKEKKTTTESAELTEN